MGGATMEGGGIEGSVEGSVSFWRSIVFSKTPRTRSISCSSRAKVHYSCLSLTRGGRVLKKIQWTMGADLVPRLDPRCNASLLGNSDNLG